MFLYNCDTIIFVKYWEDYITIEDLKTEHIHIGGEEFILESSPDVWMPHQPTFALIDALNSPDRINNALRDMRVLEIGVGTGIISMYLLRKGADYVAMTDINPAALATTYRNIHKNGFTNGDYQFAIAEVDRFMGIQERFDTIISNPPVQPSIIGVHEFDKAAKYNENGNGRVVLDSMIEYGKAYLNDGGRLITSCSSRHGHIQTQMNLDLYWGMGNWQEILKVEYPITPDYHGPYMQYWIDQQLRDRDLRVFQKDIKGNRYTSDKYTPGEQWYFDYIVIEAIKRQ